MPFDERTHRPATLTAENSSFGRVGKEGSDFIDHLAASIVGSTDGGSLSRIGICKKYLFQVVSATTQVAISCRVHQYKLALRDR